MKAHESADMNEKSGEDQGNLSHFSKTGVRYRTRSIFRKACTVRGQPRYTPVISNWRVQCVSVASVLRPDEPSRDEINSQRFYSLMDE